VAESLTDDQQHRRRRAVVELMPSTPYMSWLGIVFDRYEPDDVTIRLPFREDLKNTDGNVVAQPGTNANPPASSPVYCSWSVPHSPPARGQARRHRRRRVGRFREARGDAAVPAPTHARSRTPA